MQGLGMRSCPQQPARDRRMPDPKDSLRCRQIQPFRQGTQHQCYPMRRRFQPIQRRVQTCAEGRPTRLTTPPLDPLSKCIPVLQLGPRTHQMAQLLIHRLREQLVPGCLPLFTSDGLTAYFTASIHTSLTGFGLFWPSQHGHNSAGQPDASPGRSGTGTTHLGYRLTNSPLAGSSELVANLVSLRSSSCLAACDVGSATGARRQAESTTVSATDTCDGSRANHAQMDSRGGALLPASTCPCLRAGEAGNRPTRGR